MAGRKPGRKRTIPVQVMLTPQEAAQYEAFRRETGESKSAMLRRAVREWIQRHP